MNKRILDGGGLWKSDKLARMQPEWMRAEYANWIPLALANGVFESDTRRIWATVYSYNRPEISFEDAEEVKRELCRVGLLFLWPDEQSGKIWGYFTGIEKPGRLPSKSRLDKKHEPIGPTPPADALRSYIELTRSKALESSVVSQWLANGCLGFGIGIGIGIGIGKGGQQMQKQAASPPADSRHSAFFKFAWGAYKDHFGGTPPVWGPKGKADGCLRNFLRAHPHLTLEEMESCWTNYLASTKDFHAKRHGGLLHFLEYFDEFRNGPLLERETANGNRSVAAVKPEAGKYANVKPIRATG